MIFSSGSGQPQTNASRRASGEPAAMPASIVFSSSASSSSGSTEIGDKAFALPGFRAAATVYGITGKALLKLPEGEWASAEQVRDAVRGRLPAGVYLVKFDGAAQALKISIDR